MEAFEELPNWLDFIFVFFILVPLFFGALEWLTKTKTED